MKSEKIEEKVKYGCDIGAARILRVVEMVVNI